MMQDGLHIGLAAWIDRRRNAGGFPVYPVLPIATALVDLEAVRDVHDLAKAAEFARLVNHVPRRGQYSDAFSASTVLWQVHGDILGRMDFAAEPWTSAERESYRNARDVLYATDASGLPSPSEKLLLYEEMANAYRDLVASGGSPDEVARAMSDWMVRGHKLVVEDALETIARLSGRSSRTRAQDEGASLDRDLPGVGLRFYGDMEFAPTYFAPVSAISRGTWMEADVSFAELDHAVGDGSPAGGKWRAYRANRAGRVSFDYVVLKCLRPWFTPALYRADDWRLTGDGEMVSRGDGSEGTLPAYVDAVYLVSVKNVTNEPRTPRPRPDPRPLVRPLVATALTPAGPRPPASRPRPLGDAGPRPGGAARAANALPVLRPASAPVAPTPPLRPSGVPLSTTAAAGFTALDLGAVRRVTAVDLDRRYTMARAYLEGTARTADPSEESTSPGIYVAGFGCETVPYAPNPNAGYQWP